MFNESHKFIVVRLTWIQTMKVTSHVDKQTLPAQILKTKKHPKAQVVWKGAF